MSVEQLLGLAVPILIILFTMGALVLLVLGVRRNSSRLFMSGIVLVAISLIVTIREYPETGITLSALSIIAIAIFAGLTLFENRLIRRQNEQRENRDRKDRLLDEIINWLKGLESRIFPLGKTSKEILEEIDFATKKGISTETERIMMDLDRSTARLHSLATEIKEGEYIGKITSWLDSDLGRLIEITLSHLKQRRQLSLDSSLGPRIGKEENQLITELVKDDTKSLEGLTLSEQGLTSVRLGRNAGAIRKSILNAIDKAIEIKMNLLKS